MKRNKKQVNLFIVLAGLAMSLSGTPAFSAADHNHDAHSAFLKGLKAELDGETYLSQSEPKDECTKYPKIWKSAWNYARDVMRDTLSFRKASDKKIDELADRLSPSAMYAHLKVDTSNPDAVSCADKARKKFIDAMREDVASRNGSNECLDMHNSALDESSLECSMGICGAAAAEASADVKRVKYGAALRSFLLSPIRGVVQGAMTFAARPTHVCEHDDHENGNPHVEDGYYESSVACPVLGILKGDMICEAPSRAIASVQAEKKAEKSPSVPVAFVGFVSGVAVKGAVRVRSFVGSIFNRGEDQSHDGDGPAGRAE